MEKDIDKSSNLKALHRILLRKNIPFVSYRLPHTSDIYTLIQQQSFPERISLFDQVKAKNGFIVAPFSMKNGDGIFIISPDMIVQNGDIDMGMMTELNQNEKFAEVKKTALAPVTTSKEEFLNNVEKAIFQMQNDCIQKVVISRIKTEKMPYNFRIEDCFSNLCNKYASAMVYLLQTPETGCWAGATPELLLAIENNTAKTVSLAGTQRETGKPVEKYTWTEKELKEQQIVTDFIEDTLKKTGVNSYKQSAPHNVQAAQLIHLQTSFEFSLPQPEQQAGNLLHLLHPTPATGGLPKHEACNFILKHERHNRKYYTGFLGTLNMHQQTNLYVNLRCMQLFEKEYALYSGAGITSSSIAENEWEETENKMETMKNIIEQSASANR